MDNPEFGREMKVTELVPKTVVILSKQGRPSITWWFIERVGQFATFFAGDIRTTLILKVMEDESLQDSSGMTITINEYLGVIDRYVLSQTPPTVQ